MTLIIVVISLFLEWSLGRWQHLRRLGWFIAYRRRLFGLLPPAWQDGLAGTLLALGVPVVAMLALQQVLDWGLLELALGVLVLTYCLGPEAFNERVDAYLDACEAHDSAGAKQIAESLVGGPVSDEWRRQTRSVATAVLYEGNVRIFAVLFWFLLLGPAGALLYRTAAFFRRDARSLERPELTGAADRVFGYLDWAPARLLSLSFFLAGSFDDALKGWRKVLAADQGDPLERNRLVVIMTGCGAMRHEVDDAFEETDHGERYDLYWVRTARALVLRAVVIWVAVIALLTMAGWFV